MNIPNGFGFCVIRMMVDGVWIQHKFKIDRQRSTFDEIEISDNFRNVAMNNKKHIFGYHYDFNLVLRDYTEGSQEEIIKFKKNYRRLDTEDKNMRLYPAYDDTATNWSDVSVDNLGFFTVHLNSQSDEMFSDSIKYGSTLNLSCSTRNMVKVDELKEVIYRGTISGKWEITGSASGGIVPHGHIGSNS